MSSAPLKIGYCLSLSGPLGENGRSARLAHEIWREDVNRSGGVLGRPVELVVYDDHGDASLVAGLYARLLDIDGVDLVVGGYGTNTILPAMPLVIERGRFFVGLMGLGVNTKLAYERYFAMIPTGPSPSSGLTEGFFEIAAAQEPRPRTVALLTADAEFAKNPVIGAHENARRYGLEIVAHESYPLTTQDFGPILKRLSAVAPDVVFVCSYLADSIRIVRAIAEGGLSPKLVGGSMIGPQSASVKTALGPLLNGFVNYEYWLPIPKMVASVGDLMKRYQSRAATEGVDALGFYMAPLAYAQMQVVEQAVNATQSLSDAALADYARRTTFDTVVGAVAFGEGGEWVHPRVLQVQFQNVRGNGLEQFADARAQVVITPGDWASGRLAYPYESAKAL